MGIVVVRIINRIPPTTTATARKISDSLRSIIIAMTIEPTIIKGARVTSRINIATACCVWFMSAVSLVIREGVENKSSSL